MTDPYEDLDFDLDYWERERTQSLRRAMKERKREALERDRAESADESREWARTLIFVAICAAVLMACVRLVGAF